MALETCPGRVRSDGRHKEGDRLDRKFEVNLDEPAPCPHGRIMERSSQAVVGFLNAAPWCGVFALLCWRTITSRILWVGARLH